MSSTKSITFFSPVSSLFPLQGGMTIKAFRETVSSFLVILISTYPVLNLMIYHIIFDTLQSGARINISNSTSSERSEVDA